jgi:hypothetical protein
MNKKQSLDSLFLIVLMLCLIITFTVTSCKKDEPEKFPPVINFLSISPDTVVQFQDSVIILIRYEDQDGDIGFDNPDEPVIWVKDSRLPEADLFHLPPLTPDKQNLSIQGELYIRLKPPFLFGNGNIEQVTFSIKLRDRSNNWSETIQTTPIAIIRE